MSIQPKPQFRFEDYLAAECAWGDEKHDYVGDQVFAMAGASYRHNLIKSNVSGEIRQQLKTRPYAAVTGEMRLRMDTAEPAPKRT